MTGRKDVPPKIPFKVPSMDKQYSKRRKYRPPPWAITTKKGTTGPLHGQFRRFSPTDRRPRLARQQNTYQINIKMNNQWQIAKICVTLRADCLSCRLNTTSVSKLKVIKFTFTKNSLKTDRTITALSNSKLSHFEIMLHDIPIKHKLCSLFPKVIRN